MIVGGGCVRSFVYYRCRCRRSLSAKRTFIVKLYLSPLEHDDEELRRKESQDGKKLFGAKLR